MAQKLNGSTTLFSKIIRKELPAEMLYQDDRVTVIKDKFPQAAVHFLVIPNREIVSLAHVTLEDAPLLGHMLAIASAQAKALGLATNGYRIVINTGLHGGQEVPHLHMHILGGEKLGPMRVK